MAKYIGVIAFFFMCSCSSQPIGSTGDSVRLIEIIPSQCDQGSNPDNLVNRIVSKEMSNDTLYMTLGFSENCCIEFNSEIHHNGNILNVILDNGSGSVDMCDCDCCFELSFVIVGLKDTAFRTFLKGQELYVSAEKYQTYAETFEIIDGDTINRKNKYRYKVGLWKWFSDSTDVLLNKVYYSGEIAYDDDYDLWGESYYNNGNLKAKWNQDSTIKYSSNNLVWMKHFKLEDGDVTELYHENGQLKSRCKEWRRVTGNTTRSGEHCDSWDMTETPQKRQ